MRLKMWQLTARPGVEDKRASYHDDNGCYLQENGDGSKALYFNPSFLQRR